MFMPVTVWVGVPGGRGGVKAELPKASQPDDSVEDSMLGVASILQVRWNEMEVTGGRGEGRSCASITRYPSCHWAPERKWQVNRKTCCASFHFERPVVPPWGYLWDPRKLTVLKPLPFASLLSMEQNMYFWTISTSISCVPMFQFFSSLLEYCY